MKKLLQQLRNTPGEILQKMLDINPTNKLIEKEIIRRRSGKPGGKSYDKSVKKQSSSIITINKVNRAKDWYSR
jgi:hypothetical protein